MKISKLFHWLYAFLMFLPIFFVLGKGLYVTFNKNAKDSYYGETINETKMNNINDFNNLVSGNLYHYNSYIVNTANDVSYLIYITDIKNIISTTDLSNAVAFTTYTFGGQTYLYAKNNDNTTTQININSTNIQFDFVYGTSNFQYNSTFVSHFANSIFEYEYNRYSYLDNAIDYGMYQLNESNLFAWAKDSFLSAPFVYITNLFNMPSDSPVITALSYWLNISIIWLTFDVIMYVPLLAHRWLDKGVRE